MIYLKICLIGNRSIGKTLMWIEETTLNDFKEVNHYVNNVRELYQAYGYVGGFKRFDNADQEEDTIVLNPIEQFLITDGLTQKQIKEYVGRVI